MAEKIVASGINTATVDANEVTKVIFERSGVVIADFFHVRNDGESTAYASVTDDALTVDADGVMSIPSGSAVTIGKGLQLYVKGKVTIVSTSVCANPFKTGAKGGGTDDTFSDHVIALTKAEYEALTEKAPNKYYAIIDDTDEGAIQTLIDEKIGVQNDKINVLDSRMDTFAHLAEGSTTGDAELADIRVGYDGTVYDNAGNAVRGQISQVSESIADISDVLTKGENEQLLELVRSEMYIKADGAVGFSEPLTSIYKMDVSNKATASFEYVIPSGSAGRYSFISTDYADVINSRANEITVSKVVAVSTSSVVTSEETRNVQVSVPNGAKTLIVCAKKNVAPKTTDKEYINVKKIEADVEEFSKSAGTIEKLSESVDEIEDAIFENAKELSPLDITFEKGYVLGWSSGKRYVGGEDYAVSNQIDVSAYANDYIYITAYASGSNSSWIFYDDTNTKISGGYSKDAGTWIDCEQIVPSNAKWLLIAEGYSINGAVKVKTEVRSIKKKWTGKKWACVGDSLTAINMYTTKHYFDYVEEKTGIETVNVGVSGSGYKRLYDSTKAFYQRISSVPTDSDVVTIFGSFNDINPDVGYSLGTPTDTGTDTICGCINTTLDNLYAVMPLAVVGIVTPTPWEFYTRTEAYKTRALNYVNALIDICKLRSIPCLDLFHCSNLRPWDSTFVSLAYVNDSAGTHPSEKGHEIIAPKFEAFLDSLLIH